MSSLAWARQKSQGMGGDFVKNTISEDNGVQSFQRGDGYGTANKFVTSVQGAARR